MWIDKYFCNKIKLEKYDSSVWADKCRTMECPDMYLNSYKNLVCVGQEVVIWYI